MEHFWGMSWRRQMILHGFKALERLSTKGAKRTFQPHRKRYILQWTWRTPRIGRKHSRSVFPGVGWKWKPAEAVISDRREDNALCYRRRPGHIWPDQSCIFLNAASGDKPVDVVRLNSRVQFLPRHFRRTCSAFKMVKPRRRRSKLLLAPFIPDAFDVAERVVDDRQTVLFQPLLVFKLSFALFAYPIGQPEG